MRRTIVAAASLLPAQALAANPTILSPMFQDHAVLQRDVPIPVYGQATPNSDVTLSIDQASRQVHADGQGRWRVTMPPMQAGGPYVMRARSSAGDSQVVQDVLVGDVFLCSGQSNMQFEVRQSGNAPAEIATARDGGVRALTVGMASSEVPLGVFGAPVHWVPVAPDTVGSMSASCYFFARELRKAVHAPVGLVVAAWGGSRARAWISETGLHAAGLDEDDLALLDRHREGEQAASRGWDSKWEGWWRKQGWAGGEPWQPAYDAHSWKSAPDSLGPWAFWEGTSPDGFVGQMWLRTEATLTARQAAQAAVLDLGAVNEEEESWVNGQGVGGTSWSRQARHAIPAGVLHAGTNSIVTNIFCSWRNCGMSGPAETRAIRFEDGSTVPLSGPWRYAAMPSDRIAPQLPWGPVHGVSMIYNGMISPIGPYAFKAALWYQGESDIHFASEYGAMLAALKSDWRRQFRPDLPFLIVQLPNFGPRPTSPTESTLANIREAQRLTSSADPRSAYIVTIDVGDPDNLHPTNKQEVGRRLALAAGPLLYDRPTSSGPRPASVRHDEQTVRVRFTGVTGRLLSYSGTPTGFELCGVPAATCRFVPARIEGQDTVVLKGPGGAIARRVRYCWGDSPVCTLSDASALPASPFEADIP